MAVYSQVSIKASHPALTVSGKEVEGLAYITYINEKSRYDDFADAGYKLYSVSLFFGTNHLNAISGQVTFSKGIFDSDTPDFSEFDANVYKLLQACPDAMILPRVNVSPSREWELSHPDELCDTGVDSDPQRKRVCFSSDAWADEVKRLLTVFTDHVESSDFSSHIIGYQVAGGNTEEWFPFDMKGSVGIRSREKFEEHCKEKGIAPNQEEYFRFLSQMTASRLIEFASHIKSITHGRLIVGVFYGYTFETFWRESTHHDLASILKSDSIDFICSPISYASYAKGRNLGADHAYMLPLASLKLHGKLYFSENDTRTHLSSPPNDLPHYQNPVWYGPDKETTLEILKMHFARAFINRHALWWFDMWGGWYHNRDYMDFMKKARELTLEAQGLPCASETELAVFIDETALAYVEDKNAAKKICSYIRKALGAIGAPYDAYLTSDFEEVKERYKAFISLVPYSSAGSKIIKEYSKESRAPLLEIDSSNHDISAADIREFCKSAKVHLYTNDECVVYVNQSYIFIHSAKDGEISLSLPENEKLFEVFECREYPHSFSARLGKSFLFKREKA